MTSEGKKDPVRKWTYITIIIALMLLIWYLVSDRIVPRTSQARVHALVVPIAPEVSGTVYSVNVGNNQRVKVGQNLFHIENPDGSTIAVHGSSPFTSAGLGVVPSDGYEMNTCFTTPTETRCLLSLLTKEELYRPCFRPHLSAS